MSRALSGLAATRTLLVTDEEMAITSRKYFHQIVEVDRRRSWLRNSSHFPNINSSLLLFEYYIGY